MKIQNVVLAVCGLAMVAGCGDDANEIYEVESGEYTMTTVSAVGTDDCNIAEVFPEGSEFTLNVSETSATWILGTEDATRNPVSNIDGNTLEENTKEYGLEGSGTGCSLTYEVGASGDLTANNVIDGVVTLRATGTSGCTASTEGFKTLPCASTLTFTATRNE